MTRTRIVSMALVALSLFSAGEAWGKEEPKFTYEKVKGHNTSAGTWDSYTHCTKVKDTKSATGTALVVNWGPDADYDPSFMMFDYNVMDMSMATIDESHSIDFQSIRSSFEFSQPGLPDAMMLTYSSHKIWNDGLETILPATTFEIVFQGYQVQSDGETLAIYHGQMPVGTLHTVINPALGPGAHDFVSEEPVLFEIGMTIPEPGALLALGAGLLAGVSRRPRRS